LFFNSIFNLISHGTAPLLTLETRRNHSHT
jgi:hypothetical protein